MVKIQLPETFGTRTIHALFYEKCGAMSVLNQTIDAEATTASDLAAAQIDAALDQEILISLPIIDFSQLCLLNREAENFINWAEKNFKKTPRLLFV